MAARHHNIMITIQDNDFGATVLMVAINFERKRLIAPVPHMTD
jgi:hypothetical protein